MTIPLHIGCTATRVGMSPQQIATVTELIRQLTGHIIAHHGCCIGGDEDFHRIALRHKAYLVGHPGPGWPDGPWCAPVVCDEVRDPAPYMYRNQAIVDEVQIMIAAPLEPRPKLRGGTWGTVRMALRALRAYRLAELYVVGRDGRLLDHGAWK